MASPNGGDHFAPAHRTRRHGTSRPLGVADAGLKQGSSGDDKPRVPRPSRRAVVAAVVTATALFLTGVSIPRSATAGTATAQDQSRSQYWVATFVERADLRAALDETNWVRRGRLAVRALRRAYRTADARPRVRRLLRGHDAAATPLWIANAVLFRASKPIADEVARIVGVSEVVGGRDLDLEAELTTATARPVGTPTAAPANLLAAHVPDARVAGLTGAGVVIGIVDTGVDATHPDLATSYRAEGGWFDPSGRCPDDPCDGSGHGTAVAGVAVGERTGVAPGAHWIAARGCSDTRCTLASLLESLQFMLAPDAGHGDGPDPDLRPDVINNSWSIPEPSTALGRAMTSIYAAGILSVFAAGNTGPGCATVSYPASQPEVVAVGATDDAGIVARFSARGPGPLGPEPTLVAPGVDVVTTAISGGYASVSGTSMAAPEVSGTYALTIQAAPSHQGSNALHRSLITASGGRPESDCDTPGVPNSAYGYGLLDAVASVQAAEALG
ncbi:MAG TPA: S8 family serine peptidase [Acidimicrobiia bacterium]|nr:S8 family serine peptidase [Acidimicrobiia bacterium]